MNILCVRGANAPTRRPKAADYLPFNPTPENRSISSYKYS